MAQLAKINKITSDDVFSSSFPWLPLVPFSFDAFINWVIFDEIFVAMIISNAQLQ